MKDGEEAFLSNESREQDKPPTNNNERGIVITDVNATKKQGAIPKTKNNSTENTNTANQASSQPPARTEEDEYNVNSNPSPINAKTTKREEHEPEVFGDLVHTIAVQSLLAQFSHAQVRADFICGKFGINVNPNILPALDIVRCSLCPRFHGRICELTDMVNVSAAMDMCKLLDQADEIFDIGESDVHLTYKEWNQTLQTIATDRYWVRVPAAERCVHIVNSDAEGSHRTQAAATKSTSILNDDKSTVKKEKGDEISKSENSKDKSKSNSKMKKVEEIILSTSETEGSSSDHKIVVKKHKKSKRHRTTGDSDSATSSNTSPQRHRRKDTREVVTPPPFDINGSITPKEFFESFESFFKKKFKGNVYDQTQKLSEFFSGELLAVFNAKGGRRLKYPEMKAEIIDYCKKLKVGGKSYWRKKFSKAEPETSEAWNIFGMRLIELAERAYPNDKKECANHLREQFLKTVPAVVTTKVRDTERSLKATSNGRQNHLSFSAIMEIAKDIQQQQQERQQLVLMSAEPNKYLKDDQESSSDNVPVKSRVFHAKGRSAGRRGPSKTSKQQATSKKQQSQVSSPTKSGTKAGPSGIRLSAANREPKICSNCGIYNHSLSECWRAKNACLICGKDHLMNDCPRFDPDYKTSRESSDPNLNEQVSAP